MKIEAVNLAKRFNRDWIFRDFTYTFEAGRTYAITGPNGSGKSTMLKILWGQLPPSAGAVKHFVTKYVDADDVYRHVSIATPYMDLIEEFTPEELVTFHFKFKKAVDGRQPAEVLRELELPNATNKPISNFSSGMRQRLKLGLAFYTDTPFLFLDEPSTNLDDRSFQWYQDMVGKISNRLVIIASNQQREYPSNAVQIDVQAYK